MEKLKKFLENNDFDGAIKFLKTSGDISAPIKNYNLGYVYSQKSDFIKARYYFEKARTEGFINEELNASLKSVKVSLGVEQVESEYSYLDKAFLSTANFRDDVFFSILGLLLIFALVGFIKGKKILILIPSILFFSLGAVVLALKDYKVALLKKEAYVYQGPSRIFDPNQLILPGTKVMIKEETKDWKLVTYPKVYSGWIYKAEVKKL